jgi:hypothetical protein
LNSTQETNHTKAAPKKTKGKPQSKAAASKK